MTTFLTQAVSPSLQVDLKGTSLRLLESTSCSAWTHVCIYPQGLAPLWLQGAILKESSEERVSG